MAPFRVAAIALQVSLTPKLRMLSENISSVHSLTSNGPYLLLIRKENKSLDANKSPGPQNKPLKTWVSIVSLEMPSQC